MPDTDPVPLADPRPRGRPRKPDAERRSESGRVAACLTPAERELVDAVAEREGIPIAEVIRRGLAAYGVLPSD